MQAPDGGPNFYEFADDVLYSINVDNDGDGDTDISYQFRFKTVNTIPDSFLYNDGPITRLTGSGAARGTDGRPTRWSASTTTPVGGPSWVPV